MSCSKLWMLVVFLGLPLIGITSQSLTADEEIDAAQEFQQLATAYEEAMDAFREANEAYFNQPEPRNKEEQKRIFRDLDPGNTMGEQFFRLEENCRGTQIGLCCLHHLVSAASGVSILSYPVSTYRRDAILLLQEHYLDHANLDVILRWLRKGAHHPETTEFLRRVAADSPHRHVRGVALYMLASLLGDEAQVPVVQRSILRLLRTDADEWQERIEALEELHLPWAEIDTSASHAAALEVIDQILDEYPDVLQAPRTRYGPLIIDVQREEVDQLTKQKRKPIGELAKALRFKLEHLSIDQPAPNISQPDAFDNDLDLWQHRDKVVVLMFSFKGCGPCEAMYPDNRSLIQELEGRPFAFLGVMGDETAESVEQSIADGIITWPVWWDGPEKAISTEWSVSSWPTIYVIDHQGIIRYLSLRGPLLRQAVLELVQVAEGAGESDE